MAHTKLKSSTITENDGEGAFSGNELIRDGMGPIHPGEHLRDELEFLGMSANAFASALRVPTNRITGILNGTRSISADTALRLARYFGTTAQFWMNLQSDYDLQKAEAELGKGLEAITPLRHGTALEGQSRRN